MSRSRSLLRPLLVGALIVATLFAAAIGAGWRANVASARATNDAREARAQEVIGRFGRTVTSRLAQLEVASAFVAASYPTDPEGFGRYLRSFGGSTEFANLAQGVLVVSVEPGEEGALEAQERLWNPSFTVRSAGPTTGGTRHVILRGPRTIVDRGFVGLDIAGDFASQLTPDNRAEFARPRIFALPGAAVAADPLLGAGMSEEQGVQLFFGTELVAVQRLVRSDGSALGFFIVPVRLHGLIGGVQTEEFGVRLALVDSGTGAEVIGSSLEASPATQHLVADRVVAVDGTAWRVELFASQPVSPTGGIDLEVFAWISSIGSGTLGVLGAVWMVLRRRRTLLATIDATERRAESDHLTGAMNRVGFERAVDVMLAAPAGRRVFVMLLDLDRFKWVNDTMGHDSGDALLRAVAFRLSAVAGSRGVVARFGGDEFVYAADDFEDDVEALSFAEEMHHALAYPIEIGDSRIAATASVGIASAPTAYGISAQTLLREADMAMYRAKRDPNVRSSIFDAAMRDDATRAARLETELRLGLRRGEFVPYFQPVFDTDGGLVGFEALARWLHPERGVLPPAQFIDAASAAGCLPALDAQILRRAVEQAAAWNRACGDNTLGLYVNVHEDVLRQPSFTNDLCAVLEVYDLDPSLLTLEVSEELLVDGSLDELDVLRDIASLGVPLAIGDFGRGRSSLLTLGDYDMISALKLDRDFVRRLPMHQPTQSVFRAVRDVAHSVGMRILAVGVESTEEADVLTRLGVDQVQGFLFGHPMLGSSVTEFLRDARMQGSGPAHLHRS